MKTYGKLTYCNSKGQKLWHLQAEPHVIIRAKRVFERAAKGETGELVLKDSIEICRELEWFLERYPCEMAELDRMHLTSASGAFKERMSLLEQMLSGQMAPRDFEMAIAPRGYQRVAADLLLRTGGLLLADDVGLGKTCSAICALTDARLRPAVVVTLTHLASQWQKEIQRFAPQLSTHIVKKTTPYDLGAPNAAPGQLALPGAFPEVIIITYSKLAGWGETLAPLVKSITFDEIQELRNGRDTDKGKAAFLLKESCDYRLGLSATPIYNYGSEIHNVLEFVAPPDTLGGRSEFLREWCGAADARGRSSIADPKAFGRYLREQGLMIRRTREDVGRELPELVRVSHEIDCDSKPLKDISSAAEKLAGIILGRGEREKGEKLRASEELNNIVRHATGVAKAPYVAEFVRMLVENGEKVVLFGWHRDVYSIWQERLADLAPALYTGSESFRQKEESRKRFMAGETSVFVMSLRSGAGLDGLQGCCNTVVFGELDWSPGVHEQCIGRIQRDGQKNSVNAYYLLATEGSDPIVADVLGVKRAQVEGIRNPDQDLIEKLDTSGDRVKALAEQYLSKPRKRTGATVHSFSEAKAELETTT